MMCDFVNLIPKKKDPAAKPKPVTDPSEVEASAGEREEEETEARGEADEEESAEEDEEEDETEDANSATEEIAKAVLGTASKKKPEKAAPNAKPPTGQKQQLQTKKESEIDVKTKATATILAMASAWPPAALVDECSILPLEDGTALVVDQDLLLRPMGSRRLGKKAIRRLVATLAPMVTE